MVMVSFVFVLQTQGQAASTPLIPSDPHSALYYQLGGGQDFAYPAVSRRDRIPLKGRVNLGTGYHCGLFDPKVGLRDTFNQLYRNYEQVKNQLAKNMTSMVGHSPFYLLARANPTLYQLLTGQLLEAGTTLEVATKNCRQLLHDTEQGRNPYADWGHVAVGDAWKHQLQIGEPNVVQAQRWVDTNAYDRGVPWVQGAVQAASGTPRAGGVGQPPIHVLRDATVAGYNGLLLREAGDHRAPTRTKENAYLVLLWSTPLQAADWVVDVLGDVIVTTCVSASCDKSTQAGRGLLPLIHVCPDHKEGICAQRLADDLMALVQGQTPVSKESLLALSSTSHAITPLVIHSLQSLAPVDQAIVIDKLAQELMALKLLDQAEVAKRLLKVGAQTPDIVANAPAYRWIQQAIGQLNDEMNQLAHDVRVKRELAAPTVLSVLQHADTQKAQLLMQPHTQTTPSPLMRGGALFSSDKPNKPASLR